ncbi:winged helix-turn-helix transcriptional regulator [Streptomyces sp. NPDC032161]|uniref:winged helix-turn-helix transcriptional regulator n=1 Tax=unclassified Streptomyces TaxID=2593676 RepID=UPI0033EDD2A7
MAQRTYGQMCGIAVALDVLGERWTLLLVRELLIGPQRFNELLAGLPGMGPNLLSERLQSLTGRGVVEAQRVADDKRARLYRLTALGERLREPVLLLGRWGMAMLEPDEHAHTRAEWGVLAVEAMTRGQEVADRDEAYEFHIDDLVFHIAVADGTASVRRGPAQEPTMTAVSCSQTFVKIGGGLISPFEAVAAGELTLGGDREAILRCCKLLGLL